MIEIFQVLKFTLAMSSQADAYAVELDKIYAAATGESADQVVFLEVIETFTEPALEKVTYGNALDFVALWEAINSSEAPTDWVIEALKPIIGDVVEIRQNSPLKVGTQADAAWRMVFETMISAPELEVLSKLDGLGEIPAKHMILSIATGKGKHLTRWWYSLGESRGKYFLKNLKVQNRFIKGLKAAVNPDDIDAKDVDPEVRVPIVRAYLEHPFIHYTLPFNSATLTQLINFKCLTADEIFEDPDGFVNLHFRQGMAYLDLARIYRTEERYKEALAAINTGMTTRLQFGNRLGQYLMERAIIYRDAENIEGAHRSLNSVPFNHLDASSKRKFAEIEKSLVGIE